MSNQIKASTLYLPQGHRVRACGMWRARDYCPGFSFSRTTTTQE